MVKKYHIKKGDTVYVNHGEYRGKTGRVLEVITSRNKAIVEGVNIVSKHAKPDAKNPQGGIIRKEAPIHISNLNLVDPSTGEATRIGKRVDDNGKLVRYSKKSGEVIK